MVEKSAGSAYKIATSLTLLAGNLVIGSSYEYFATTAIPQNSEWDFTLNYTVPQIKGFTASAAYGYAIQPQEIGGNNYQGMLMLSYLY